jgi:hypothetical protein
MQRTHCDLWKTEVVREERADLDQAHIHVLWRMKVVGRSLAYELGVYAIVASGLIGGTGPLRLTVSSSGRRVEVVGWLRLRVGNDRGWSRREPWRKE